MTPEQAREIDRQEFDADCRRVRALALSTVASRRAEYERWLHGLAGTSEANAVTISFGTLPLPRGGRQAQLLTHNGETLPLTKWSELVNIPSSTIRYRLNQGWTVERALTPGDNRGRKPGVASDFGDVFATGAPSTAQHFSQLEISE